MSWKKLIEEKGYKTAVDDETNLSIYTIQLNNQNLTAIIRNNKLEVLARKKFVSLKNKNDNLIKGWDSVSEIDADEIEIIVEYNMIDEYDEDWRILEDLENITTTQKVRMVRQNGNN